MPLPRSGQGKSCDISAAATPLTCDAPDSAHGELLCVACCKRLTARARTAAAPAGRRWALAVHGFRAPAVYPEPGAQGWRVLRQGWLHRARGNGVCGGPAAPTGTHLIPWGCTFPHLALLPKPTHLSACDCFLSETHTFSGHLLCHSWEPRDGAVLLEPMQEKVVFQHKTRQKRKIHLSVCTFKKSALGFSQNVFKN